MRTSRNLFGSLRRTELIKPVKGQANNSLVVSILTFYFCAFFPAQTSSLPSEQIHNQQQPPT